MAVKYTLIFILFAACACNNPSDLTESEKKSIRADIAATLNRYYADIRQDGLAAEFKYLDSSSDFYWVPPGYTTPVSYDSVATVLQQSHATGISIDNSWKALIIKPLTKELATYSGSILSRIADTAGKVTYMKLVETGVMIKRADGWKLLSGQTSLLP